MSKVPLPKWITPEIKKYYNIEVKIIQGNRYTMLRPKKAGEES